MEAVVVDTPDVARTLAGALARDLVARDARRALRRAFLLEARAERRRRRRARRSHRRAFWAWSPGEGRGAACARVFGCAKTGSSVAGALPGRPATACLFACGSGPGVQISDWSALERALPRDSCASWSIDQRCRRELPHDRGQHGPRQSQSLEKSVKIMGSGTSRSSLTRDECKQRVPEDKWDESWDEFYFAEGKSVSSELAERVWCKAERWDAHIAANDTAIRAEGRRRIAKRGRAARRLRRGCGCGGRPRGHVSAAARRRAAA